MNNKTKERISKILNAYFNDSLPPKLEEGIRNWFKDKGHEEEKYNALEEQWNRLVTENHHPGKELLKSYREMAQILGFPEKHKEKKKIFRLNHAILTKVAAVLIPAIILGATAWFVYQSGNTDAAKDMLATITIDPVEKHPGVYYLSDSTEISINPGSQITYPRNFEENRTISLTGEAFFKVTKNEEFPFVVRTEHLTVTVLGTEFFVSSYPDAEYSTVSLYEGSVQVKAGDSLYIMEPGTRFEFEHLVAEAQIKKIPTEEIIAKGYKPSLQIENAPLSDIIKAIEANYNVTFNIPAGVSLGGSNTTIFEDGLPLTKVLVLLKYITPGYDYRIEGHNIIMIKTK